MESFLFIFIDSSLICKRFFNKGIATLHKYIFHENILVMFGSFIIIQSITPVASVYGPFHLVSASYPFIEHVFKNLPPREKEDVSTQSPSQKKGSWLALFQPWLLLLPRC